MKTWRKYPKGDPEVDLGLLEDWLNEDLAIADLPGTISLEYALSDAEDVGGLGKSAAFWWKTGGGRVAGQHTYHTSIPGTPWPMDLGVVTSGVGSIASLTYVIRSDTEFGQGIRFAKERTLRSGKFVGDRAEELNKNKALVKQMRGVLSARHDVPERSWFGLMTRALKHEMFLAPAYYEVFPTEYGAEIVAFTQVFPPRDLSMLTLNYIPIYKGEWRLGIAQVIEGVRVLESLA